MSDRSMNSQKKSVGAVVAVVVTPFFLSEVEGEVVVEVAVADQGAEPEDGFGTTGSRPATARSTSPFPGSPAARPMASNRSATTSPASRSCPAEATGKASSRRALSSSEHTGISGPEGRYCREFPRRTFSLAELTEDVPVRNVSPAPNERECAGQTGKSPMASL